MPDKNKSSEKLSISMPLRTLEFRTHVKTGVSPQTRPGVGFTLFLEAHPDISAPPMFLRSDMGPFVWELPCGVIGRDQARKLRNLLTEFLLDFPEEEEIQ